MVALYERLLSALDDALKAGKKAGTVGSKVKTRAAAHAIATAMEGSFVVARATQDDSSLKHALANLRSLLDSFR